MSVQARVKVSLSRHGDETYKVVHDWPAQNDPTMIVRTYRVTRVIGSYARSPNDGDIVTYRSGFGSWVGLGYELMTEDEAKMEERPIPPPPKKIVRGRPVRWTDGRWQIQTARGWK